MGGIIKPSKVCKICGANFIPNEMSHNQIYCSRKCNKKSWYYSPKGQIQRKNALKKTMIRYHNDKDFKKRWKKKCRKYKTSIKGKVHTSKYRKKYRKTEPGKLADLKYRRSSKRKVSLVRYTRSEKGKANGIRGSLKRRGRLNSIIHIFTSKEWLQKLKNAFGVCKECNLYVGVDKLTLDHIIPISKASNGQIYTINDVQPLCLSCNISKNDKIA